MATLPLGLMVAGLALFRYRQTQRDLDRSSATLTSLNAPVTAASQRAVDLAGQEAADEPARGPSRRFDSAPGRFSVLLPAEMIAAPEATSENVHTQLFRDGVRHLVLSISYVDVSPAQAATTPRKTLLTSLFVGPAADLADVRALPGKYPGLQSRSDLGDVVYENRSVLIGCRLFALQLGHAATYKGDVAAVLDSFTPRALDTSGRCRARP